MRTKILILCIVMLWVNILLPGRRNVLQAQKWEIGLSSGISTYLGDLAPDVYASDKYPYFSLFIKNNLSQFFSVGFSASSAHISGDDNNYSYLAARNLKFETDILEFSTRFDFHFFPFAFGLGHQNFTPFVTSGISLFRFEPYVIYNGNKTKLPDLDTEGRIISGDYKKPYSLLQFSLPVGGGFKFKLGRHFNAGVVVTYNYCLTDYLDDVSTEYYDKNILITKYGPVSGYLSDPSEPQIGSPGKQRGRQDMKDWYIFGGIFISYKIKDPDCFNF